jgi:uncharacterized protein YbjT (DUF2867 family)
MINSTSAKHNVLLIGSTGTLGSNLLNALTDSTYKSKFNVFTLIRKQSQTEKPSAINNIENKGAKVIYGDINDDEKVLADIMRNNHIDVVLSAVGFQPLDQLRFQSNLLSAAKSSGCVKLFIPSEFGPSTQDVGRNSVVSMFDIKLDLEDEVKQSGLEYLFISVGIFSEFIISPFFGVDISNTTVTAPGSFDTKVSITNLKNTALNVAALILSDTRNQKVLLADSTLTYDDITKELERITGKQFVRKVIKKSEFETAVAKKSDDIGSRFSILLCDEKGTFWNTEIAWNHQQHQYATSFNDFLTTAIKK